MCVCVWAGCRNSVTLMDSFISLAPFMSLRGSLLAAQTKVSVCVLMRPGPGSGEELDTCGMGVRINKCLRSHPFFLSPLNPRTPKFLSDTTLRFCPNLKWAATGVGEMHNSPSVSLSTVSVSEIRCLIHTWSNGLTIKVLERLCVTLIYRVVFLCSGAHWNKDSHFVHEWFLYSGSLCSYLSEL